MKKLFLTGIFLAVISVQTYPWMVFRGFSPSGDYCGFYEVSEGPRVGDNTVRYFVVDVLKNEYTDVKGQFIITEDDINQYLLAGENTYFQVLEKVLNDRLESYYIEAKNAFELNGNIPGIKVYQKPETLNWNGLTLPPLIHQAEMDIPREDGQTGTYTLKLEERLAPGADKGQKIFTLTLIRDGKSKILQADKKLYKSRQDPVAYSLDSVYYYQGRLAVFIDSFIPAETEAGPGYAGRVLIVTGDFKIKP